MPRTRLLLPLSAVWFAVVLLRYHGLRGEGGFPPGHLPALVLDAFVLAGFAFAAWGAGFVLMRGHATRGEAADPVEALGLGLGAIALGMLALGAVRLLNRPAAITLVGAAFVAAVVMRFRVRSAEPPAVAPRKDPAWTRRTLGGLLAIGGGATLAASLTPPYFYDALVYHLAVPRLWIEAQAVTAIPGNYYAAFPANMGMLYAAGLMLRGAEAAQGLHWLCGAATAWALHRIASRHFDRGTAWLAVACFALTPGVMLVSTYAIADLGVTLFAVLCFGALCDFWGGGERRRLVTAACFAGLALGTKYTAAVVVCFPSVALIVLRPAAGRGGERVRRIAREGVIFLIVTLAVVSPWLVRNAVTYGHPLAPYFGAGAGESSPAIADEMARRLPKDGGAPALIAHWLSAPWSATMERLGAGGYLLPVFLMLIPLLVLMRGLPAATVPMALLAGAGCVGWAATTQVTRYLMPVLPIAACLAALAARRLPRWLATAAVGWCLLYGVFLYLFFAETLGVYRVMTGVETREEYLEHRVNDYAALRYLESVPAEARVLLVGEGGTFYCPRSCVASTPFDRPAIERYASGTEAATIEALRGDGITHMLVSDPELRRAHATTADAFMDRYFPGGTLPLLFERYGVRVYAIPEAD